MPVVRRSRDADGRECVLDEVPIDAELLRVAPHDPVHGLVAAPDDPVLRGPTPGRPESEPRGLSVCFRSSAGRCRGRSQVRVEKLVHAVPRIA